MATVYIAPIHNTSISDEWMDGAPTLSLCSHLHDLQTLSEGLYEDGMSMVLDTIDDGSLILVRGSKTHMKGAYAPLSHDSRFVPLQDVVNMRDDMAEDDGCYLPF